MLRDMLKYFFAALMIGASATIAVGCAENTAASAKCKQVTDGDGCKKCCSDNGANGSTFVTGGACTCRGG